MHRSKHDKDAIIHADTIERAETLRLIQNASVKELSTAKPFDLKQALELSCKRVEEQERLAEEKRKKLEKPMKEYKQRFNDVEEIKKKFILTSDSELLPLLAELEQSMLACERAFKPIRKIDPSISPPCFDHPPSDAGQRLTWASHIREYLRNRKEKRGY
jgi:hypothetical protein